MGIMGLMNSKGALGKDQHNSSARLRIAKKDIHLKAGFKEVLLVNVTLLSHSPGRWDEEESEILKTVLHILYN